MIRMSAILLAAGASLAMSGAKASVRPEVTIHRDDWGVPHIFADSEAAGYYGLGYAQAEDRPQRTQGLFLFARGEVARFMGKQYLAADLRNRLWRHREMAEQGARRLSPRVRRNYEAYLAGVNAWFAEHPEQRLPGIAAFDLVDLVALVRAPFIFGYQAGYAERECRADEASATLRSDEPPGFASNGWAVMPARTRDGALILGADPHVENTSPMYYEFRMHAGGIEAAGYALGPLLWQVHTRNVAWSMTTGGPDIVDCYRVEVDPANPDRYRYDGVWKPVLKRHEVFQIAGEAPVTRTFEYTMHNGALAPVIRRDDTSLYAASIPAMRRADFVNNEIHGMVKAADVKGVRGAMATSGMFQQNIIVGDRDGHLWYVRAGTTAIRPSGYDWTRPVPGNTSKTAWLGLHALRDHVQIENPESGFLQNNNVAPDVMGAAVDAAAYPVWVFNDRPGRQSTRGRRTVEVLAKNDRVTIEDALALSFDETWTTAEDWLAGLRYASESLPDAAAGTARFRRMMERLLAFDGRAQRDSRAAADFYVWRRETASLLADPAFAPFAALPWKRADFTPAFAKALLDGLHRAAATMDRQFGGRDPALGDLFYAGRAADGAPVGGISIERRGDKPCNDGASPFCDWTMRAFEAAEPDGGGPKRILRGSQSMRLVQFTSPIRSYTLYGFGQSDDPASRHFNDQARLFGERRMKPTYFERDELTAHIESTTTLIVPRHFAK